MYFPLSHAARRRTLIVAVVVLVLIITALVYRVAVSYVFSHPLRDPTVGFTYLEPRVLPAGYHITGRRLHESRGTSGDVTHKLLSLSAELNIGTQDWIYEISESRATAQPVLTSLRNYDPATVMPTCIQQTSPGGQLYRLCHWRDWGTLDVYEVQFVYMGTFVHATFPAARGTVVSVQKLGQFVDSFQPAKADGLPVMGGAA